MDSTGRPRSTTLHDGRELAWTEWGEPDARPILFCTGAGMSGRLSIGEPPEGHRIVAVDRPGLGRSDPHPGRTLDDWVDDCRQLLADRPAPVVGFSQGSVFALALTAAGLATSTAVVAGQDDLHCHDLSGDLRAMVDEAAVDPDALEARVAATATPEWLLGVVLALNAPADREVFERSPFLAEYRASLEDGFRQGAAGYARDLRLAFAPWPFHVCAIASPVLFWYGSEDRNPVHSPDHGFAMSARIPGARRRLVEGAGAALLWQRADDILAEVVDAGRLVAA